MIAARFAFLASMLLAMTATHADDALVPPAMTDAERAAQGAGVQRTARLLASSTPEHRRAVRIVFYGQSITQPAWTEQVVADLRRRFPHADIEARNLAIGGFASQDLSRVALHDVPAFYPDLVVFHVYGSHENYEEILRLVRTTTTAEILIQTDHVNDWSVLSEATDPKDKGWWPHMMNDVFLPQFVEKYGCGLVDVRQMWGRYLRENGLEPKDLLTDSVHLNARGDELMAGLVARYVEPRSELDAPAEGWVRDYVVGKDVRWQDGKLALPFRGNRVDVLAAPGDSSATAEVLVDGRKPSEHASSFVLTRPSSGHAGVWPAIKRVTSNAPLVAETWTVTVTETNEAADRLTFRVEGSITGFDGEGTLAPKSDWPKDEKGEAVEPAPFVSSSGRIVIKPSDWNLSREVSFRKAPLQAGFQVRFEAKPLGVDTFAPPADAAAEGDNLVTLAQLLPNGEHTLELRATNSTPPAIRAIRVYEPPLR